MKYILFLFFTFLYFFVNAQSDYTLIIDGKKVNIDLDTDQLVKINDKSVRLRLSLNDTLNYNTDLYAFNYPKIVRISKSKLSDDVDQIAILTAEGSGLIIQSYYSMDPSSLNETMMKELTKESVSYGFELTRNDYKRKLKNEQEIMVNKAVLKYKDEINIYEIASFGKKDEGIMIITLRMNNKTNSEGEGIIRLFWDSLSISK